MRISELAKKMGVKSTEIIAELKKLKVTGKTASSRVEDEHIPAIKAKFSGKAVKHEDSAKTKKTAPKKPVAKKTTAKKAVPKKAEKKPGPAKAVEAGTADAKPKPAPDKTEEAEKHVETDRKKRAEKKVEGDKQKTKALAKKRTERTERKAKEKSERKEAGELKDIEREIEEEERLKKEADSKVITIDEVITVKELSEGLNLPVNEIIRNLFVKGVPVTVNQNIGIDLAKQVAEELGYMVQMKEEAETEEEKSTEDLSHLPVRPPIVTVMGHVDHGKTSLLDRIRKTEVAATEAGGITQHIGAYSVHTSTGTITFLDTPGHEAFTALRARGAQSTDLVILVVAADDGVMPQTVEAINHAKAADVMIVVAVNKIDKPGADPEKIKQELSKYGLAPEEWGGDTIFCNVSAKSGEGIDTLLEMVQLQAEVLELHADPNLKATATVIESKLDKNRGPVHSIIVNKGTLKVGDPFVVGTTHGRVRAIINEKGEKVASAGPSIPLELLGASDVADPGEVVTVVESDRKARQISQSREGSSREKRLTNQHTRLENVVEKISDGQMAELKIVIKADTQGSVDAVRELLSKQELEEVRVRVIHCGVGGITESDVSLADASDAIVVGFSVRPTTKAKQLAEKTKIDMRLYNIIYEITDEITASVKGLLKPKFEEKIIGRAEVRNTFKISRIGTIAGCIVSEGKMHRGVEARLIRDNVVIYTGSISSLKRFKDDAKEVKSGFECGITLEKYNDLKLGDIVEYFAQEEVAREE